MTLEELAKKQHDLISDIRGPLYDHDMHDLEDQCDKLVAEYAKLSAHFRDVRKMEKKTIPHIKVSVTVNGNEISQAGTFFLDAIAFLCKAEMSLRQPGGTTADEATKQAIEENKKRLGLIVQNYDLRRSE